MKILVIGDSIIDHYIYGKIYRQSPEDHTIPVVDITRENHSFGGALNVVSNVKALFDKKDEICYSGIIAKYVKPELESMGVKLHNCYMVPGNRIDDKLSSSNLILKSRIIDDVTQKQIVRVDNRQIFNPFVANEYKTFFTDFCLEIYDCIIISDYNKGTISSEVISKLKKFKGVIFVDTKKKDLSIFKKLKNVIVKINLNEYVSIVNNSEKYIDNLIVTLGREGAELINNGKTTFKLHVENVVDSPNVCGAGDVFLAGLALSYMKTNSLMEAIRFANICASKSVEKPGTSVVTYKEVQDE